MRANTPQCGPFGPSDAYHKVEAWAPDFPESLTSRRPTRVVVTLLAEMHAEMSLLSLNSLCADLCSTTGDGTQAGASKVVSTKAVRFFLILRYPLGRATARPEEKEQSVFSLFLCRGGAVWCGRFDLQFTLF